MDRLPAISKDPVFTQAERNAVDWEAVERDYRAGLLSMREVGQMHRVSHVAILKRASKLHWTRDLTSKIQAQADQLVDKSSVTNVISHMNAVTEQETINTNALVIANVRLRHRKTIERLQALSYSLLEELEMQSVNPALMAEFGEMLRAPNEYGGDRLNDLYQKIVSAPGRIEALKKLAEVMKIATGLEREAWSMDKVLTDDKPVTGLASLLLNMRRSALPVVVEVERDGSL